MQARRALTELIRLRTVMFVVDEARFGTLSSKLRSYATYANDELLRAIGFELVTGSGEVFVYTSEGAFFSGCKKIREESRHQRRGLSPIITPTPLFVERLIQTRHPRIHFDFGLDGAFNLQPSDFEQLSDLALLSRISNLASIYVVQDAARYALSMEIEGKTYAIGFLTPDDARSTMDGLAVTNPGCRLEPNSPRKVAGRIAKSEFAGLVLNPAHSTQVLLDREKLEQLRSFAEGSSGPLWKRLLRIS